MTQPTHVAGQDWTWTQTPDPANMIFTVFVETKKITLTNKPRRESNFGVVPYVAPTKFKELAPEFGLLHLNSQGVAEWYFIGENIEGPRTAFHFYKNQTPNEILASPWDTIEEVGNHFWHPIVLAIWVEEDPSFPQSTNVVDNNGTVGIISGPTYKIRDKVLADVEEGSTFVTRKYLSAIRPPLKRSVVPQPQPMFVQANGVSRDYGKVLHPRIVVHATPSGINSSLGTTAVVSLGGGTEEQIFEATNRTERKPYILSFKPQRNQYGLWETVEIEVRPPKTETIISR